MHTCRGSTPDSASRATTPHHRLQPRTRLRDEEELAAHRAVRRYAHGAFSRRRLIEIPVSDPSRARSSTAPRCCRRRDRVMRLGAARHGERPQETSHHEPLSLPHVVPAAGIAAGCSGNVHCVRQSRPARAQAHRLRRDTARVLAFVDVQQRRHESHLHREGLRPRPRCRRTILSIGELPTPSRLVRRHALLSPLQDAARQPR